MQQLEDKFLQAAQDEQLQLRQQTDRIIQNLKDENKLLKHELFRLRGQMEQLQAQQAHQSKLWEVSREEVDLKHAEISWHWSLGVCGGGYISRSASGCEMYA